MRRGGRVDGESLRGKTSNLKLAPGLPQESCEDVGLVLIEGDRGEESPLTREGRKEGQGERGRQPTHLNNPKKAARMSASCSFMSRSSRDGTASVEPGPPTRCTSARTALYLSVGCVGDVGGVPGCEPRLPPREPPPLVPTPCAPPPASPHLMQYGHCTAPLYRPQSPPPDAVLYDGSEQLAPGQHLVSGQAGHLGQLSQHHGGPVLSTGQAGEEEEERHAHLGGGDGGGHMLGRMQPAIRGLIPPPLSIPCHLSLTTTSQLQPPSAPLHQPPHLW